MENLYISRRFDRNPKLKIKFYGYLETIVSQAVTIAGVTASTMICKNINTHRRLLKQGWKDCTKIYYQEQNKKELVEASSIQKITKSTTAAKKRGRPKAKRK